jgi:5'-nucleotidase
MAAVPVFGDQPYHIVVTNDDGIDAPGLSAVVEILGTDPDYQVTVVAPAEQQSGSGTALVIRGDIAVRPREPIAGCRAWSVEATPATTARLAVTALASEPPPRLLISGINRGENIGRSAWYSGTVGAAREAVLAGVPAIAASLELDWSDPRPDYPASARWLKALVDAVRRHGLPEGICLNVNLPRDPETTRGFRLARMGLEPPQISRYELVRQDQGTLFYRSRWRPPDEPVPGTDVHALENGWIPIVPLGLDQTHYPSLATLQDLELGQAEPQSSHRATDPVAATPPE